MAAGSWKDWTQGEIVTEPLFQDIQDSIAFIYASESAANTALTNKVEGTQFYDTTDNVLKIWNGASWDSVGGGLVLLTSSTASASSSLIFDNFVDDTKYTSYKVVFENIAPATDNATFRGNFRQGGASGSDLTGTYRRSSVDEYINSATSGRFVSNQSDTNFEDLAFGIGTATGEDVSGLADFFPSTSNKIPFITTKIGYRRANNDIQHNQTTMTIDTTTLTTGLKFYFSTGNIASGTIYIYGVSK